jgi:uncharacterized protein DUF4158
MSRRTLLSSEQRARLFGLPVEAAEMAKHYVLNPEDLALVRAKRRSGNRLGFAIQLCALRHPGRALAVSPSPRRLRPVIALRVRPERFHPPRLDGAHNGAAMRLGAPPPSDGTMLRGALLPAADTTLPFAALAQLRRPPPTMTKGYQTRTLGSPRMPCCASRPIA